MKVFLSFLMFLSLSTTGCTGKTPHVNTDNLPTPHFQKISKTSSFHVGNNGQNFFSGRPSTISGIALGISIDLKQIQEAVANKTLVALFNELNSNNYKQDINIISKINNFSYRIPVKFSATNYVMVSFDIEISAQDKDGNHIYTNQIRVKDYESTGSYFPMAALALPFMQSDTDKLSQLVGDTTTEKVYEIYVEEFEQITKIHLERKPKEKRAPKLKEELTFRLSPLSIHIV